VTYPASTREAALRAYAESGHNAKKASAATGIDHQTILRWARQAGLPVRRRGGYRGAGPREWTKDDLERLLAMYQGSAMQVRDICAALGCSASAVYKALRIAGVQPRHEKPESVRARKLPHVLKARAVHILKFHHGWSGADIAAAFSMTRSRANQIVKEGADGPAETPNP
jgi:transposase-like protein